jgi:hypothetical protein
VIDADPVGTEVEKNRGVREPLVGFAVPDHPDVLKRAAG